MHILTCHTFLHDPSCHIPPISATKIQEGRPNMFGRPSCSRSARGSPVRALRGRGSWRSPLLAPSPLPGFLRDLALRARVRCRCTLRCAAAGEEEGRPRRPYSGLADLCCTPTTRRLRPRQTRPDHRARRAWLSSGRHVVHPGSKCLKILARSGLMCAALTAALQVTARTAAAGETATRAVLGCADS